MAETEDDRSIWRLLADEHAFFAELAKSEKLADELVRSFLEEGEIDRDGRVRYRVWQIRALPGGAPSPYGGAFWQSDPERDVRCEIDHRNSSAHWTGPASAEWKASGRKTAEYQVLMIRLNHLVVLDFLMGVGLLPLPEQPASEPAMEPAPAPATVAPLGVTGTLNVTQAAQTISSTGAVVVGGALNVTQAAQTLSATGAVTGVVGTLNVTQAAQTLVAAGSVMPLKVIDREEWLDKYLTKDCQVDLSNRHNKITSVAIELHAIMLKDPTVEAYAHARNIERHPMVRKLFPPSRPSKKKKS